MLYNDKGLLSLHSYDYLTCCTQFYSSTRPHTVEYRAVQCSTVQYLGVTGTPSPEQTLAELAAVLVDALVLSVHVSSK